MTEFGIESVKTVITTHKHWDHANGNEGVIAAYPDAQIIGGEIDNVKSCTKSVKDKEVFDILDSQYQITCHHTPCHTTGHILFELTPKVQNDSFEFTRVTHGSYQVRININRCVFTGDTVFIGGCGRFFEGNAEQMLNAMDVASQMSPDTKVFCGHEYTI